MSAELCHGRDGFAMSAELCPGRDDFVVGLKLCDARETLLRVHDSAVGAATWRQARRLCDGRITLSRARRLFCEKLTPNVIFQSNGVSFS